MFKKIDFIYNDANYNSEFLIKILIFMKNSINIKKVNVGIIDAVPNDQEKFEQEKGLFSEEVFKFNDKVRDYHGVQTDYDELFAILKQCRTVWEISVAMALSDDKIMPSLEDTEKTINNNVLIELKLIEGDLFTIFYREDFDREYFLEFLADKKVIIEKINWNW